MSVSKALTWDELANVYDKEHPNTGRPARTLSMDTVFKWAERQTKRFYVSPKEGTIHSFTSCVEEK